MLILNSLSFFIVYYCTALMSKDCTKTFVRKNFFAQSSDISAVTKEDKFTYRTHEISFHQRKPK